MKAYRSHMHRPGLWLTLAKVWCLTAKYASVRMVHLEFSFAFAMPGFVDLRSLEACLVMPARPYSYLRGGSVSQRSCLSLVFCYYYYLSHFLDISCIGLLEDHICVPLPCYTTFRSWDPSRDISFFRLSRLG